MRTAQQLALSFQKLEEWLWDYQSAFKLRDVIYAPLIWLTVSLSASLSYSKLLAVFGICLGIMVGLDQVWEMHNKWEPFVLIDGMTLPLSSTLVPIASLVTRSLSSN